MPRHDLTEALQALVRRHGMSSVLHGLADLQAAPDSAVPSSPAKRAGDARSKPSAIDYVGRMPLPPDKAQAMERAAQCFEDKSFLPGVADIREFCASIALTWASPFPERARFPGYSRFLQQWMPTK